MTRTLLLPQSNQRRTVLCLGAHSDDIEIGCGGTILKMLDSGGITDIHWVVLSSDDQRAEEARTSANVFLEHVDSKEIIIKTFRDSFFPYVAGEIKEFFEQLKKEVSPDVIFTHHRDDLHQDHRLVSELTWNSFRNQLICEYEIPKYDGDLGRPNLYVHLDEPRAVRKAELILTHFSSQKQKSWFDARTFLALMRLRGMESNSPDGFAEAFYCRKVILGFFA